MICSVYVVCMCGVCCVVCLYVCVFVCVCVGHLCQVVRASAW